MEGRAVLALGVVLACCPCASALNPALDVSQYAHTGWKFRDGFAEGEIRDIVQTSDGYLWLASDFGLFRFDGVQAVLWQPPAGQHLPSTQIWRLLAAHDGTLWIGTWAGLASWKNGKLTQYPELDGLTILSLLEEHAGSVWAGAGGFPNGKLCEIQRSGVRCASNIGLGVQGLHEDAKGNLWVGSLKGIWRWKPGPLKFYPVPDVPNGIQSMVDGEDATLLIPMAGGVGRLVDGKAQMAYPFPAPLRGFEARRILRDRDGGLWTTLGTGIVHFHQGRTDVFSQADGLTGEGAQPLFE